MTNWLAIFDNALFVFLKAHANAIFITAGVLYLIDSIFLFFEKP